MNTQTPLLTFISVLFCCLCMSTPVSAFEKNQFQVKVVTEYLEPYQVKNEDGTLGGFSTDIVTALFKQANSNANIQVMPWARAYEVAKNEKNVMIYSIAHTPKREDLFHWVGSLKEERLFFWGLKSQFPHSAATIALLKGYRIAASRKSNVAQYLADNQFFNVRELINEEQNIQMLYSNRVDLIVATEQTAMRRAKRLGLNPELLTKVIEAVELNNDLCIGFNLDTDPAIVEHFQQAYREIRAQGVIEKFKQKWGLTDDIE